MTTRPSGERPDDARVCRRVRDELCAAQSPSGPLAPAALAVHLAECAGCAAFARRLALAREALATPLAAVAPDAQFAARVLARIERPAELIGWAVARALPAALGLAVVLAWLGLVSPPVPPPSLLLDDPPTSDQLLAWSSLSPEIWP